MKQTKGVREGRILRVAWEGREPEYYSSITALFARNTPAEVGASYNSVKCYLSRNGGRHTTAKCTIEYVTLWVTERGPRKLAQTK